MVEAGSAFVGWLSILIEPRFATPILNWFDHRSLPQSRLENPHAPESTLEGRMGQARTHGLISQICSSTPGEALNEIEVDYDSLLNNEQYSVLVLVCT